MEIRQVIFGGLCDDALMQAISVADWRGISQWDKQCEMPQVVQWFWEHLEELGNAQLLKVLEFCSGMHSLPLGGFSALGQRFSIEPIHGDCERLPVVHTCLAP